MNRRFWFWRVSTTVGFALALGFFSSGISSSYATEESSSDNGTDIAAVGAGDGNAADNHDAGAYDTAAAAAAAGEDFDEDPWEGFNEKMFWFNRGVPIVTCSSRSQPRGILFFPTQSSAAFTIFSTTSRSSGAWSTTVCKRNLWERRRNSRASRSTALSVSSVSLTSLRTRSALNRRMKTPVRPSEYGAQVPVLI